MRSKNSRMNEAQYRICIFCFLFVPHLDQKCYNTNIKNLKQFYETWYHFTVKQTGARVEYISSRYYRAKSESSSGDFSDERGFGIGHYSEQQRFWCFANLKI